MPIFLVVPLIVSNVVCERVGQGVAENRLSVEAIYVGAARTSRRLLVLFSFISSYCSLLLALLPLCIAFFGV